MPRFGEETSVQLTTRSRALARLATAIVLCVLVSSCGGGGGYGGGSNTPPPPSATYSASAGVAQKGPLLLGSSVTAQELNASLSPTGKQYSYQTTSDFGIFNPNSTFTSPYIGISASGYYFDEVANGISTGPITLNAYSDLSAISVLNVNLLTTLAYQRIQNLVSQSNLTFAAAERQAQSEVLATFGIRDTGQLGRFNTWDLSKGRDGDRILAALSSVFVYGNTPGNLAALIASFQNDLAADGIVSNPATKATLLASARAVDPAVVASNLSQKYASAGVSFTAADIGNWLDQDGDGVTARFEFQVADATQASSFTLPAFVRDLLVGSPTSLSTGQLSVNGTPVTAPTQIASGDTVTISPPSGTFPDGALTTYLLKDATQLARVTFVRGLVSIAVTPANSELQVGSVRPFAATGTFTDGSTADVTASATWSSSEPAFATVNATTAMAQGVAVGTTTISATSGSITGSTALNVIPAQLISIAITPASPATGVGIARQLQATGTYSDGSTANLTPTATWTSSVPAVATVTGGMVTGVSLGSTDISATTGAITGGATLHVTSNTWSPAASLSRARQGHTATVLPNGKVLVAGGRDDFVSIGNSEIYDPVGNTWSSTATMVHGRRSHTATLLQDGKVLVAGGLVTQTLGTATAELYDPSTNSWSPAASMPDELYDQTAVLLPNGKVLIAGGSSAGPIQNVSLYDPATNTWSRAAAMAHPRTNHTMTLLPNGKVLVTGGTSMGGFLASAELYDPAANTWVSAGSMMTAHVNHTATALPNGKVLVVGGVTTEVLASAEIYDSATNTWTAASSMATARVFHGPVLLPNGNVMVVGGTNTADLASTEIYDPVADTWTAGPPLAAPRYAQTTTALPDGQVVVIGGFVGLRTATCEIYW